MSRLNEVESAITDLNTSVAALAGRIPATVEPPMSNADVDQVLVDLKASKDAVDALFPAAPKA